MNQDIFNYQNQVGNIIIISVGYRVKLQQDALF
jgi:hypothetical protein